MDLKNTVSNIVRLICMFATSINAISSSRNSRHNQEIVKKVFPEFGEIRGFSKYHRATHKIREAMHESGYSKSNAEEDLKIILKKMSTLYDLKTRNEIMQKLTQKLRIARYVVDTDSNKNYATDNLPMTDETLREILSITEAMIKSMKQYSSVNMNLKSYSIFMKAFAYHAWARFISKLWAQEVMLELETIKDLTLILLEGKPTERKKVSFSKFDFDYLTPKTFKTIVRVSHSGSKKLNKKLAKTRTKDDKKISISRNLHYYTWREFVDMSSQQD